MEVQARQVSAEFLELMSGTGNAEGMRAGRLGPKAGVLTGRFPVHSVYGHGFNLLAAGMLCFAGNKHEEQLPHGILLSHEDMDRIAGQCLTPGQSVFRLSQEGNRLVSGAIAICLDGAQIFTSRYGTEAEIGNPMDPDKIFSFVKKENTGFGGTIEETVSGGSMDTAGLAQCFQSRDEKKIRHVLEKWVGYGPGLTPSGDDFLLGILFAHHVRPFLGDVFMKALAGTADTFHTTMVSVNQYRCAFGSLFSGSFLDFARGIRAENMDQARAAVERILGFGHTSGRDMAAGIWMGLKTGGCWE